MKKEVIKYDPIIPPENTEFLDSIKILNEGIIAADPESSLKPFFLKNKIKIKKSVVNLKVFDNVYIVAIGKAADTMAKFVAKKVSFKQGMVVLPSSYTPVFSHKKIQFFQSGHPLPNRQSIRAATYLEKLVSNTQKNDFVIFLISGGGSALISQPMGITLKEKILVNKELIHSGASINEISCVRKHISKIKGGKIVQKMKCAGISLVISDVIGDDLSSISSGLTFADKTTFSQALKILKKYKIHNKISKNIIHVLQNTGNDKFPETPKKPMIRNIVIANNHKCLLAMKNKAKRMNYTTNVVYSLNSDVKVATKKIIKTLESSKKQCLIFGGETTVNVRGKGKGGRSQELVLRILQELHSNHHDQFIISSIGTDGIDGNTKFAGAITSTRNTLINKKYLKNNDSFNYFKKFGNLIYTGPTHTNVNDIGLIIRQIL
jgi:hydroxypyruvate reductase